MKTGDICGEYTLGELIGAGGMGEVFRAHSAQRNALVAIKFLHAERLQLSRTRERFLDEARALTEFSSVDPGLVRYLDFGIHQDGLTARCYLVMELLEGESCEHWMLAVRPLSEQLELLSEVCRILAVGHARHIRHRSLKPSNIFLTKDGQVKLIDFGVAKLIDQDGLGADGLIESGMLDSVPYLSLTALLNSREVDDLWPVGAILYECIAGVTAYPTRNRQVSDALNLRESLPLRRRIVRDDLWAIIARCLGTSHYTSITELRADIERVLNPVFAEPLPAKQMSPVLNDEVIPPSSASIRISTRTEKPKNEPFAPPIEASPVQPATDRLTGKQLLLISTLLILSLFGIWKLRGCMGKSTTHHLSVYEPEVAFTKHEIPNTAVTRRASVHPDSTALDPRPPNEHREWLLTHIRRRWTTMNPTQRHYICLRLVENGCHRSPPNDADACLPEYCLTVLPNLH